MAPSTAAAMEPPPAPISISSTAGTLIGRPEPFLNLTGSTSKTGAIAGSPPSMAPSFAVVPPMSKLSTRSAPMSRPIRPASSTPAAGPLSTMRTGYSPASAGETSPPFDCMMESPAVEPAAAKSSASRRT